MRNVMNRKRHWLLLLLLSPFFLSCEDKMDEHYEKPEWLKGTAWEVLSNEYGGKFSMFLEAAELSGFKLFLMVRVSQLSWLRTMMRLLLIWKNTVMFQ